MKKIVIAAALAVSLPGCSGIGGEGFGYGGYSLVRAERARAVGDGSMIVTPPREWNRSSPLWQIDDIRAVEDWTLNG
ncbi:hypothetical protein ACUOF9_22730, partial [Escherichia coli]